MNLRKIDVIIWIPRVIFLGFILVFLAKYAHYLASIITYPYDWEPTDGDHLNFAHRIAQGLPIYLRMSDGGVLSIYNPLYHLLLALIGGQSATMELGRTISLASWIVVPLTIFFAYRKQWGWFLALACALFTWLPTLSSMLIDMVQVNQNTLMAALFLGALISAERVVAIADNSWWQWVLTGALACLCFFAKQQGIIAPLCVAIYFLFQRRSVKGYLWAAAGGIVVLLPLIAYFEYINRGQFIQVTLLGLANIMVTTPLLGRERLTSFLLDSNAEFFVAIIVSAWFARKSLRQATIWQISFVLHLPLLLKILGNAGGGDNYLATLWISMCVIAVGTIARFRAIGSMASSVIAEVLLLAVMYNATIGSIVARSDISRLGEPTPEMAAASKHYYEEVKLLIASHPGAHILANRNIGALVYAGADIENEGSTMFNYAWRFPAEFPKDYILSSIAAQKYDFIATGISAYSPEIQNIINKKYRVVVSQETNVLFSRRGKLEIFAPKSNKATLSENRT